MSRPVRYWLRGLLMIWLPAVNIITLRMVFALPTRPNDVTVASAFLGLVVTIVLDVVAAAAIRRWIAERGVRKTGDPPTGSADMRKGS